MKEYIVNGVVVIRPEETEKLICDTQSALDLIMSVKYNYNTDKIAIDKNAVSEDINKLSTGIAGEILQKFINYGVKMAVFGDFSIYTGKALKDFIRESNRGRDFFFVESESEAVNRLCL